MLGRVEGKVGLKTGEGEKREMGKIGMAGGGGVRKKEGDAVRVAGGELQEAGAGEKYIKAYGNNSERGGGVRGECMGQKSPPPPSGSAELLFRD